jgi:predicted DNA repair protein MutK
MPSGFFAILDDIAALMDDVAVSVKLATRKTAGILGDDLAVNAEKATGFLSSRELPVIWAITKGSFINKLIILPAVFLLEFFFPALVTYILVAGGLFLAYEGMHKIYEFLFQRKKNTQEAVKEVKQQSAADEKTKIRSAITTDFILSVEIVIIALGTVMDKDLTTQIITVSFVALIATVGVYGLVALIVRMDDAGLRLIKSSNDKGFIATLGHFLVKLLPRVINLLSIVGTLALLLVSGGIFNHNIPFIHDLLPGLPIMLKEFLLGVIAGIPVLFLINMISKIFKRNPNKSK